MSTHSVDTAAAQLCWIVAVRNHLLISGIVKRLNYTNQFSALLVVISTVSVRENILVVLELRLALRIHRHKFATLSARWRMVIGIVRYGQAGPVCPVVEVPYNLKYILVWIFVALTRGKISLMLCCRVKIGTYLASHTSHSSLCIRQRDRKSVV